MRMSRMIASSYEAFHIGFTFEKKRAKSSTSRNSVLKKNCLRGVRDPLFLMPYVPAGLTPNDKLRVAAIKGHTSKVLELIETGATCDADRDGQTALHFASHFGHSDTVAALILAGCDVNTPDFSGHTALQRAAAEGHVDIVQQLLKHGAQVDHQDDVHGNTALHEAAWKGYSQTMDILCKARANAYIKNKGGFVPLHLACQNGHNQSCRVLLWSGCRPDVKNNYGDTPLHTSGRYGHAGVMRILLSARCDVNEQNKNGDTALHIASAMGRRKLTRILLEVQCDRNVKNKQGETAMDIARRKNFAEVGNILANPPPVRKDHDQDSHKQHKKREKESGTSRDSKDSGSRHKSKHKKSKRGHGQKGHRSHDKSKGSQDHVSPYGCHYSPSLMPFQSPKLDSLPTEPLQRGEQYFLDLGGNIKKGPVGMGYACYCVPFFRNVEKKMESDKQELMEHIDLAHDNLNAKITNLERRTRTQLVSINEGMKERLAAEKAECVERTDRVTHQERERHRFEMESLARVRLKDVHRPPSSARVSVSPQLRPPPPLLPQPQVDVDDLATSLDEDDDDDDEDEEEDEEEVDLKDVAGRHQRSGPSGSQRTQRTLSVTSPVQLAAEVAAAARASSAVQFRRSKSEEVLSERDECRSPVGLSVKRQMAPSHRKIRDRELGEGHLYSAVCGVSNCDDLDADDARLGVFSAVQSRTTTGRESVRHSSGYCEDDRGISEVDLEVALRLNSVPLEAEEAVGHPAAPGSTRELDQDSGYTTKLHSSFESQSSCGQQVAPINGLPLSELDTRLRSEVAIPYKNGLVMTDQELASEFDGELEGQFFYTVNHEMEKWYERRLQSLERRTVEEDGRPITSPLPVHPKVPVQHPRPPARLPASSPLPLPPPPPLPPHHANGRTQLHVLSKQRGDCSFQSQSQGLNRRPLALVYTGCSERDAALSGDQGMKVTQGGLKGNNLDPRLTFAGSTNMRHNSSLV